MNKKKSITSLKKAKTSLDKIIQMIESDEYCIDIIQQNLSVIWLVKSANQKLLEDHLNCCFVNAVKSNDKKNVDKKIEEILKILQINKK